LAGGELAGGKLARLVVATLALPRLELAGLVTAAGALSRLVLRGLARWILLELVTGRVVAGRWLAELAHGDRSTLFGGATQQRVPYRRAGVY
ncbi:MAG: hypothetical protein ABJA87_12115, partial [bacterium]